METYRRQYLSKTFTVDSQIIEFVLKRGEAAMIDVVRHLKCSRAYTKLRTKALIRNGILSVDSDNYIRPNPEGLAKHLSEFFKLSYNLFELLQTVSNGNKGTVRKS